MSPPYVEYTIPPIRSPIENEPSTTKIRLQGVDFPSAGGIRETLTEFGQVLIENEIPSTFKLSIVR